MEVHRMTLEEAVERVEVVAQATLYFRPEVTEAMEAVVKAARAFPEMLSALESVDGLGVECIRDGRTAPADGCDCDTCHDFAQVKDAIRAARKALGATAPPQRCASTVTEWTENEERTVPCNHPLPCPRHPPRAVGKAGPR